MGMKLQKIADVVGVSIGTVHGATENQLFNSEKLPGDDGKYRPTHYAPRVEPEAPPMALVEIIFYRKTESSDFR